MKRTRLINFKVSDEEYASIQTSANLHAGGNVSVWLRTRGILQPQEQRDIDDDDDCDEDPQKRHGP